MSNGQTPKDAFVVGQFLDGRGRVLHVGRAWHGNSLIPGRVGSSTNT